MPVVRNNNNSFYYFIFISIFIIYNSFYLTDFSSWREITVCFSFFNFLYGKLQVVNGILNLQEKKRKLRKVYAITDCTIKTGVNLCPIISVNKTNLLLQDYGGIYQKLWKTLKEYFL